MLMKAIHDRWRPFDPISAIQPQTAYVAPMTQP